MTNEKRPEIELTPETEIEQRNQPEIEQQTHPEIEQQNHPEIVQRELPEIERSTDHPTPGTEVLSESLRYEQADQIYE